MDRHLVRGARADPEYRSDAWGRCFDTSDGGPGRGGVRRRVLRRQVPRRPEGATGCPPRAARGRHRRVPSAKGSRGRSRCSFRSPGRLRYRYVGSGCGCSAGRIGGLAPRATLAARHRVCRVSARGRHSRYTKRHPGPVERGVRRDQLSRNRDLPRGSGAPTAGVGGTRPAAHARLPWSRPRLIGSASPGHRECGRSWVRGVLAVARCGRPRPATLSWLGISTRSDRR